MSRAKELAVKLMKYANEITHWNFLMEQEEDVYFVGTAFRNQRGQEMGIYYLIGEGMAELQVISMNSRYDYGFLKKKVNEIALEHPVYAMGMGDNNIAIKSPMLLEVLDRDMATIVRKRMVAMLQAMADITSFNK